MILVDSNIPMYLVGADHPHKAGAARILDELIASEERLAADAEVFQEILHRYAAIGRPEAIQPAFDLLNGICDEVLPVRHEDVEAAKQVLLGGKGISARDALHVAVMRAHGMQRIVSFDGGYDGVPGIQRIH